MAFENVLQKVCKALINYSTIHNLAIHSLNTLHFILIFSVLYYLVFY